MIRLIMGEIRQGATEGLVAEAISLAAKVPQRAVREAMMFSGDIGEVARVALKDGPAGLSRLGPQLFHPISPMLASTAEGEEAAARRPGEAGWEYKIDGARVQMHKAKDQIRIFTRHLKEVTERLPEIVELVRGLPMREAIIEGEATAMSADGRCLPFQTTMRRFGRVKQVARMQQEIPLYSFFFGLLYLHGEPLFRLPYRERTDQLIKRILSTHLIPRLVTGDKERIRQFLKMSLEAGHEGLMAKALGSPYTAGQRGFHWLKVKPAHTLDLLVLGAEWGHGRRRGWLSNLHLGAMDPVEGEVVILGKTFKGLTNEMLRWQTKKLLELEIDRDEWTVYVKPKLVVEIAYSDIQESPRYPGGLVLRFARVRRFPVDKSPVETDTIQRVRRIFERTRG